MGNQQQNQQSNQENMKKDQQGQSGTFRKDPMEQDNRANNGARENNEDAANEYERGEAAREQKDRKADTGQTEGENDMPPLRAGK